MEINKDFKLNINIGHGWKYLTAKQSCVLDAIIKCLENETRGDKRLWTGAFVEKIGINYNTLSRVLGYLVSARIIQHKQYGRLVLYSFITGWRKRLKEVTKRRKPKLKES